MIYIPIERDKSSFQKPLTANQIYAMCRHALGATTTIQHVKELAVGMFNNTFLVEAEGYPKLILRVGPDKSVFVFDHESLLLQRENSIEPHFKAIEHLVPQTIFADFSGGVIDRDYVLQSFLQGKLWDEVKDTLTEEESESLWCQLGEISTVIHKVQGKKFGFPYPKQSFNRWSEAVINIASNMQADVRKLALDDSGTDEFIALLQRGIHVLDEINQPKLIHGDLWPKNVLFVRQNKQPKIVGLLDAERGFWGDPMAEWIYHHLEIPSAYWAGYGGRPYGENVQFRDWAYLGLYSIQFILEAWRFKYDDEFARKNLYDVTNHMIRFLA